MPGTILKSSGRVVTPERRMSSRLMTKTAAAVSSTRWGRFATEVTLDWRISSQAEIFNRLRV